jgi:ABC-type nitrate/sulfonate/bicarbonate transport system substrate-binding protein
VHEKNVGKERDLVRRLLRARTKANQVFWKNEKSTAEILAKYLRVELPIALESYRLSRPAYTTDGIPRAHDVDEVIRMDTQALNIADPLPAAKVFDFSLQRQVNEELGMR